MPQLNSEIWGSISFWSLVYYEIFFFLTIYFLFFSFIAFLKNILKLKNFFSVQFITLYFFLVSKFSSPKNYLLNSFSLYSVRWSNKFIFSFLSDHVIVYPTSITLTYFWSFGLLAGLCLVIQMVTGVFLAMHYLPSIASAFESVEHIMRNVQGGWLIRYMHSNGASMFFILLYIHLFRGIYYGSYMAPRQLVWLSGMVLFILVMGTAFLGYVLPWGQMSYWGATVITNLCSALPFYGKIIVEWLWGGFAINQATLNRFFSIHYLLPFLIVGLVIVHLSLLHNAGSNNPLGINNSESYINFFPYFVVKDLFLFINYLLFFFILVFFFPNLLAHPDNYIIANSLSTPAHIVPEWYFLPFYAILRSIPDKLLGVLGMFGSLVILCLLPFINTSVIRSTSFRPIFKYLYWFLISIFLLLGWLGQNVVAYPYVELGVVLTSAYFLGFGKVIPFIGVLENPLLINKLSVFFSAQRAKIKSFVC